MSDDERDQVKALLIEMRRLIYRGLTIGECVAWNKLKALFGVGEDDAADALWLRAYLERQTKEDQR